MVTVPKELLEMNLPNVIKGLTEGHDNTPDGPLIRERKNHLVFVYGTLKKGFPRHGAIARATFIGNAFTAAANIQMWVTQGQQRYPVIFWNNNSPSNLHQDKVNAGRVFGEVYLMPPRTLDALDCIEDNGYLYQRREEQCQVIRDGKVYYAKCWIYMGIIGSWRGANIKREKLMTKDGSSYYIYLKEKNE